MAVMAWGAYRCAKHIPDGFLAEKQGKIQPGVFLGVSWMSSVLHNCIFPPL